MPLAETRHFGLKEYSEDSLIRLPLGIPGFENEADFVALQLPDQYPLVYLQSIRTAGLCFLALPVQTVDRDYRLELSAEDSRLLETVNRPRIGEDVLCLGLVAVSSSGPTMNLLAPVVLNLRSRIGAQCINAGGEYSHRHPLTQLAEAIPA